MLERLGGERVQIADGWLGFGEGLWLRYPEARGNGLYRLPNARKELRLLEEGRAVADGREVGLVEVQGPLHTPPREDDLGGRVVGRLPLKGLDLRWVLKAASREEHRGVSRGFFVHPEGDAVYAVALDGYRLHRERVAGEVEEGFTFSRLHGEERARKFLTLARALGGEAVELIKGERAHVMRVTFSEESALYALGDTGAHPDYRRLIPPREATPVVVRATYWELEMLTQWAGIEGRSLAAEGRRWSLVRLRGEGGDVYATLELRGKGEGKVVAQNVLLESWGYEGPEWSYAYNLRYVLEALEAAGEDGVAEWRLLDGPSPVEVEGRLALVVPLRE